MTFSAHFLNLLKKLARRLSLFPPSDASPSPPFEAALALAGLLSPINGGEGAGPR